MHLRIAPLAFPLVALLTLPSLGRAQGALTPPGAPAPSMKSLGDLDNSLAELGKKSESRVAIDTLPGDATALYVISQPGSYYVRRNISTANNAMSAIRVTADGVTLDLNGFTLQGSGAGSNAAAIQASTGVLRRIAIRNGSLRDWYTGIQGDDWMIIESLSIENVRWDGVFTGNNSVVRQVQVNGAGHIGIQSGAVEQCRVESVISPIGLARGIVCTSTTGCVVQLVSSSGSGPAYGISSQLARDCRTSSIIANGTGDSYGISAQQVRDCSASQVQSYGSGTAVGIAGELIAGCRINSVDSDGPAYGLQGSGSQSRVDSCSVSGVHSTSTTHNCIGVIATNVTGTGVSSTSGGGIAVQGINASLAESCNVSTTSGFNASSTVVGIAANQVQGCRVVTVNGSGTTTIGISGVLISNNYINDVSPTAGTGYGISGSPSSHVHHNTVSDARTFGIQVSSSSMVVENNVRLVGLDSGITNGAGIYTASTGSRIVNNTVQGATGSDYGIRIAAGQNFITNNRCTGTFGGASTGAGGIDSAEFNIVSGNRWGDVVVAFAATGEILATNPFSNFAD